MSKDPRYAETVSVSGGEDEPLLFQQQPLQERSVGPTTTTNSENSVKGLFFQRLSKYWLPHRYEDEGSHADVYHPRRHSIYRVKQLRSFKRRVFLLLTEPDTSILSAVFFVILVVTISLMNVIMMMQTLKAFQFTPTDCRTCGGGTSYLFDDDDSISQPGDGVACVCPPTPQEWTTTCLSRLVYFFTVEWTLRVLTFEPSAREQAHTPGARFCQWFGFVTSASTILDALAIFPYYIEMSFQTNGLMSLRLLRLFRVFQLVRLGQYNDTFMSLSAVLFQSFLYLKLLLGVLLFGAAFFGSMMYWLEKGDWKYYEPTQSYEFVRTSSQGQEEISPFTSIPASFWWFFVTATTVGYGDEVPWSSAGRSVATLAMLLGVLVIAFPVSVFSDLWQKELRRTGALASLYEDDEDKESSDSSKRVEISGNYVDQGTSPKSSFGTVVYGHNHTAWDVTNYHQDLTDQQVIIQKSDLAEIVANLQTIHESQRQIRAILRKYKQEL